MTKIRSKTPSIILMTKARGITSFECTTETFMNRRSQWKQFTVENVNGYKSSVTRRCQLIQTIAPNYQVLVLLIFSNWK